MTASAARRLISILLASGVAAVGLLNATAAQATSPPVLNLETLSGYQEEQMLQSGQITSVELVRVYLARIAAINKAGPALNAVTQINPQALQLAAQSDWERSQGIDLGPAMGLPILLKDIIDATPMYTSAGDWALRQSYAPDSGVARELKAHGAIILGKTGLSEWANSFGSQPSGFSNLTGQVLSAIDTAEGPSGSSSGSGAAASSGEAALTIGTETSGSIISPSTMQADVGLRPTVGLVPGYGIAPIDASQDTAGPIVRDVSDAAITLQSIAEYPGSDPTANQEYLDIMGQNYFGEPATGQPSGLNDIPAPPAAWNNQLPDYSDALTLNFVQGKRIAYNGACTGYPTCTGTVSSSQQAIDTALNALAAAGAILVPDPTVANAPMTGLPSQWEAHATIDEYYTKDIDPTGTTPVNQAAEVAYDNTDPQEAEKDGISTHAGNITSDDTTITSPSSPDGLGAYNQDAYDEILPYRKISYHTAIDVMMNCPGAGVTATGTTNISLPTYPAGTYNGVAYPAGGGPETVDDGSSSCPAGTVNPVIAIVGSTGASSPAAGYPEMVVPMGYTTTQRRNIGVDISGGAYDEYNIIGVGYVIEQGTQLRQPVGMVDPASYRCANTVPPEPFASRGGCNASYQSVMSMLGGSQTIVPTPLETTSASTLESMLAAGTLTSQQLVKADLTRIALANAEGPGIQAVAQVNADAIADAIASDAERAAAGQIGPLMGIPVILDNTIGIAGLPTTGGSIALQYNVPAGDSTIVKKLRAAGAIILGDANTTELNGIFNNGTTANMPAGYSSLGGQVLLPNDTNKSPGGSAAGSTGSVAAGFAPLAVGVESDPSAAALIVPAANAGVVALKPTVGLVSRAGIMPDTLSQDSPGPIGQTVTDVANELTAIAGPDPSDPATASAPAGVNYAAGLSTSALSGKKIAVVSDSSTTDSYSAAVAELPNLGATDTVVTPGAATTAASIIPYEFHKDMDAYLAATPEASTGGPSSLQAVLNYYNANPVEGLKFPDTGATNAEAVNYNDGPTTAAYQTNLATGQSQDQAVINNILNGGYAAIMVPASSSLIGVADRAGYPVLTVPDGFVSENNSAGGDPNGVVFIGTSWSDGTLLDLGYAFEQGLKARATGPSYMVTPANQSTFSGVPSETNQSMWRCVPGSAFFSPYECNAGDLESPYAQGALSYPVDVGAGASVAPQLALSVASPSTSFGALTAGVANIYTTTDALGVTTTAGSTALTISDPDTVHPGELENGTFFLLPAVQAGAADALNPVPAFGPVGNAPLTLLSYNGPVSNDAVTLTFEQSVAANEALRTGTYSKTFVITLSTNNP